RIPLFYGSGVASLPFQIYLDRRVEVTGVYDAVADQTTFTVPYGVPSDARADFRLVLGSAFTGKRGTALSGDDLTWSSDTTFAVTGDQTAGPCAAGLVYECRLTFSRQYPQN